jgi:hypothetical protein
MDITALTNNLTTLALLYGWALFAAAAFALGEQVFRRLFGRHPGRGDAQDQANG